MGMKVLELFAGTRSISKAFEAAGHETFTVELDKQHENISLYEDILNVTPEMILEQFGRPKVIWASPPCTTYSIAAISHHRSREGNENLLPKSGFAIVSDELVKHTLYLIQRLRPEYWFIENPRGGMRKMDFMQLLPRYTVTYCQYGDFRMKPTDLWTNHPNPEFKPMCKNGDPCHEAAPRGSKTGTQGLKNAKERSVIPTELCNHIVSISEGAKNVRAKSSTKTYIPSERPSEVRREASEKRKEEVGNLQRQDHSSGKGKGNDQQEGIRKSH